jgi:hypothetical protein
MQVIFHDRKRSQLVILVDPEIKEIPVYLVALYSGSAAICAPVSGLFTWSHHEFARKNNSAIFSDDHAPWFVEEIKTAA